jgi:hypothetical protein
MTVSATIKTPKLTPLENLAQAAECLKTLAHPHRLRIVQMLLRGRYTVGGFLTSEKEGRNAYYQIVEIHLGSIMACIEARFGGARE